MADAKKPPVKQHEPTAEERDERVSLHPEKGENVLRRLLGVPEKKRKGKPCNTRRVTLLSFPVGALAKVLRVEASVGETDASSRSGLLVRLFMWRSP